MLIYLELSSTYSKVSVHGIVNSLKNHYPPDAQMKKCELTFPKRALDHTSFSAGAMKKGCFLSSQKTIPEIVGLMRAKSHAEWGRKHFLMVVAVVIIISNMGIDMPPLQSIARFICLFTSLIPCFSFKGNP